MRIAFQKAKFMLMKIEYYSDGVKKKVTGYLSYDRIDENTIPTDWHMYDIREDETREPITVENHVMVDYFGSFLTSEKLDIPDTGFFYIHDYYIDYEEK